VLDSVVAGETGIYFSQQTPASIIEAIQRFERLPAALSPWKIRAQALRFTPERFQNQVLRFVAARWQEHIAHMHEAAARSEESLAMSA